MCKKGKSVSPPPPPVPQQHQQRQEKAAEEATAGVMPSRRALKRAEVRRYSAGERRERIERYRSKRHRRNFQKKITYACRKTLAEKRNRVRGRFAHVAGDEKPCLPVPDKTEHIPSSSNGSAVPEWWPAMEEAMTREEEEDSITNLLHWDWDWEMLASYLGYNLCSTTDPSIHPST
uniref:Uncharacterized protein n=2 Tax=Avena sativa TaxID=4498 RepID=A0ACD5XJL7_AVESA